MIRIETRKVADPDRLIISSEKTFHCFCPPVDAMKSHVMPLSGPFT